MKLTALQLKQAGFDDETILGFIETQRPILKQAGFSDQEINKTYGIVPKSSLAITDKELGDNPSDVYENHPPLGSKPLLEKKTDEQTKNNVEQNKAQKYQIQNKTTFDLLKDEDQKNILGKIDEAYKLFKEDSEGRVGFISNWMEDVYPNVTYDKSQFLTDRDLNVAESAMNEINNQDLLTAERTKDILTGKVGYDRENFRYTFDKDFVEAEAIRLDKEAKEKFIEEESKKYPKILNTSYTTGPNALQMMESAKQYYGANDFEMQNFNEFFSFLSAVESDNRNIHNPNSTAAGYFQMTKGAFRTGLNRLVNRQTRNNPDYQVEQWIEDAYDLDDITELSPDKQKAVAMAYLLEKKGTDPLIKEVLKGNVDAMKKLYREHWHSSYQKNEKGEYIRDENNNLILSDLPELDARVDKYFGAWGQLYEYQSPQMAFFSSDSPTAKAIEKLPYGKKVVNAFGGRGRYNVFSNGYDVSVNGLINNFHQNYAEKLANQGYVKPEEIQELYRNIFMYQEQSFSKEIIQGAVTLVNDLPFMAAGCFAASGVTTAATGGVGAIATPVVCGAGGFALPEVLRDSYMRAIDAGEVNDIKGWFEHFADMKTAITAGKTALIGGATFGAGAKVKKVTGSTAARLGTEVVTMTTLGAFLEGHVPSARDFAHATVLVFGIHGSIKGLGVMKDIYKKYAVHPKDVVAMAEKDGVYRNQLLSGEIPAIYEEGAVKVLQGLEKQNNIKLLPHPKFKNNEVVNINVAGTEQGRVISKEAVGNENILLIEKPNGERIPILETEARKTDPKPIEVKIDKDKITINNKKDNTFKNRREEGEYNNDIVELVKDKDGVFVINENGVKYKSTPLEALNDLGPRVKITSADGKVSSNGSMMVNNKFYPKMSKEILKAKETKMEGQFKTAKDLVNKIFNGMSSKHKKASIVFGVNGGGQSGSSVDIVVGRIGKEYVGISRKAYNELAKFTDVDGKTKKATMVGTDSTSPLAFLHPETNELIALLAPIKLRNNLLAQANRYFKDHKIREDMDGMHFDRVQNSKSGDNWGIPNDAYRAPERPMGENSANWKQLFNSPKGIDLIDLVQLYKTFVEKSPELNKLPEGLNGYFQFKGKKSPRIVINEALQKNPEQFMMTFAHELGHLIDYLPDASLKRGNILGSIASLKGYMNKWIAGKNDGAKPLDPKEIAQLKKQAEKVAKENEKNTNKEIKEELKITPETILEIFKDPKAREKIDPEFYNAFVKLSGSLKKEVVKDAMKGMFSQHIKALADRINGKKVDPKLSEEANRIFKQMFEKEIKERGLVNKEWITQELKSLSMKWKPFNRSADPKYTAYRDGPRELMADFMMAWLLRPNWVKHNAPRTYEMWNYYIDAKPEVKASWEKVQMEITAGPDARYGAVVKSIGKMSRDVNKEILDKVEKNWKPDMVDLLGQEAIDSFFWIYRRLGGTGKERWHSPFAKELNWAIENYRYRHAKLKRYMDEMNKNVIKPARDLGYTEHEIHTMLLLRNLAESTQREGLVSSLGLRKYDPELAKKLEVRDAKEIFDYYAKLHPELLRITDSFYEVRQRMIIPEIKESGMYDAELITKLENNREYVTFNVKKYLLKRLEKYGPNSVATRHLKSSKGTLDEIQNVFNSTMEKDMLLLIEAKRHRTMAMTVQWLKDNKSWLENYKGFDKEGKPYTPDKIIQKPKFIRKGVLEPAPEGMEVFSYMKNGELQTWFVNKFVAKAFRSNPFAEMQMFRWMTLTGDVFRKFFTEYNPAFWPINFTRDLGRGVKLLPNARYLDIAGMGKNSLLKYYFKGFKPAYKSIFGDGTKLTRWMEEEGFLISMVEGYRGQAGSGATRRGLDPDTYMLERLLSDTAKRENGLGGLYDRTFGELFSKLGNFARVFERAPKIGGLLFLKDQIKRGKIKMDDKELMLRIQSEVGSPNFLRQGRLNSFTNNLYLYSNAFKEGWRADITRFKEDPKSVGGKFIAYNVMPKVLQKAIEIGIFGTALGYAVKYGISEWDRVNYIPILLGFTEDGRPVYFRIPQDESSRLINGMLYKMMGIIDDDDGGAGVLETPADLFGYLGTSGLPSMNPVFDMFADLITWMSGDTPYDDWRGTTAIDQTTDKAGGARKNIELLKWFLNTYTGQGFYKFKSNDMNQIQSEIEKILDLPIIGRPISRFVKVGQHPAVEYMKKGEDGLEAYDKADANLTLDYKEGIKNLTEGKPLEEKHKRALATKNQDLLSNNMMLQRIIQMAGGDILMQEIMTEKNNKKRIIMMYKLIDYIEKTDSNYPLDFKKKEESDNIEE